jgi:hypothetical protein
LVGASGSRHQIPDLAPQATPTIALAMFAPLNIVSTSERLLLAALFHLATIGVLSIGEQGKTHHPRSASWSAHSTLCRNSGLS